MAAPIIHGTARSLRTVGPIDAMPYAAGQAGWVSVEFARLERVGSTVICTARGKATDNYGGVILAIPVGFRPRTSEMDLLGNLYSNATPTFVFVQRDSNGTSTLRHATFTGQPNLGVNVRWETADPFP